MRARGAAEWIVLAASIVVVVLVAGVLVYEAVRGETPAAPAIQLADGHQAAGGRGWLVPATVTNRGSDEAAELTVEATADVDGTAETSAITIDYLAGDSSVDLTFGFSGQPSGPVDARVVSFTRP